MHLGVRDALRILNLGAIVAADDRVDFPARRGGLHAVRRQLEVCDERLNGGSDTPARAHVLMHVVDISGFQRWKSEKAMGYFVSIAVQLSPDWTLSGTALASSLNRSGGYVL
jgi:hypothetical protein